MVPEIQGATDRTFCHFGPFFALLIPENRNFKIEKKHSTIIWCMVPEIWSTTDRIFYHSGLFFVLLPYYGPRESKFWKNEKIAWTYYHFTHVYHIWKSYDVWLLRYEACQTVFFVILDRFLPFCSPNNPKNQKLKKWKKHLDILSFYTCVP